MEAVRSATRTPVSVLGATGYTGVALLRILAQHPAVELVHLSSEQYRGRPASEVYPFLSGIVDETLGASEPDAAAAGELIFLALPHGAAASLARDLLRRARLVANPGCYPTAALLGLAPLARAGLLSAPVVIDAKSGTTGAGRAAKVEQLFAEVNENFRPYAIGSHRHAPEIEQELRAAGATAPPVFVPHLLPVSRGILTTMYVRVPGGKPALDSLFEQAYSREPFIVLRGAGPPPELREVRGTNRCAIGWRWDEATQHAIVVTAIDNLGKGAAGQAVQCLNV